MLLPKSNNIFGRAGKRRAHWLYRTTLADKIPPPMACIQFRDTDGTMMVELKIGGNGLGSQPVFPGSVHESGETIEWHEDGALVTTDDDKLLHSDVRAAPQRRSPQPADWEPSGPELELWRTLERARRAARGEPTDASTQSESTHTTPAAE
jgi:hypothetical protein